MTSLLIILSLLLSESAFAHAGGHELRSEVAKTGSMLPNIPIDSTLTVDESFYATTNPRRFDIVVVKRLLRTSPMDPVEKTMKVVSRIIGLPGEMIALRRGRVYINGRRVKEPFGIKPCPRKVDESFPCGEMPMIRIPAGEYFLLADNRPESEDSRLWSPQTIPRPALVGKVIKVVIPSTAGQQTLGADSP